MEGLGLFHKNIDLKQELIDNNKKESFRKNILIKQDEEKNRLMQIKRMYDNDEITEDEIDENDMEVLIALYKEETDKLNKDTEARKIRIKKMLDEMKAKK